VHPASLPTLEVGVRMIEQTPGVTRLLDRLAAAGLVTRERSGEDRRLVECRITPRGLKLLAALDGPIDEANRQAVQSIRAAERASLLRLLELMRGAE
jgi:DNA-binding MarR family transcriptional regulator